MKEIAVVVVEEGEEYMWLQGLGGQNREEGQGVYNALGAQLSPERH